METHAYAGGIRTMNGVIDGLLSEWFWLDFMLTLAMIAVALAVIGRWFARTMISNDPGGATAAVAALLPAFVIVCLLFKMGMIKEPVAPAEDEREVTFEVYAPTVDHYQVRLKMRTTVRVLPETTDETWQAHQDILAAEMASCLDNFVRRHTYARLAESRNNSWLNLAYMESVDVNQEIEDELEKASPNGEVSRKDMRTAILDKDMFGLPAALTRALTEAHVSWHGQALIEDLMLDYR